MSEANAKKGKPKEIVQEPEHVPQEARKQLIVQNCLSYLNNCHLYNVISIIIAIIAVVIILIIAADECKSCFTKLNKLQSKSIEVMKPARKSYWVYGKNVDSGYLKNVHLILDRLGFTNDPNATDWDLLWAHDYPFRKLYSKLNKLKPHQKVNHFPGCGYITNKVDLATSNLKYIPPAFKLPVDKDKFIKYAASNVNASFVQKNNDHRNIKIKKIEEIDLNEDGTFVQEYVDKPLLVSGYKFDVGIYTVITSIDPLRIYIYNGDALLRFCPVKYYPFDPNNLDKYVVGDDYLPIWKVPDLDYFYNELGFSMKESLNSYLKMKGQDPSVIWEQIEDSIRTVVLAKESLIVDVVNRFPSKRNFFELMRIDFVVDENLKVYLMEANMSPNLSSAHYPPNQLLYEQVLFNMMGLIGVGERLRKDSLASRSRAEEEMQTTFKNLAVSPLECSSPLCRSSCMSPECQLCLPCLTPETKALLVQAYREHLNKGDYKRIFPPTMTQETASLIVNLEEYSVENQLHCRWFIGKCLLDTTWCN